MTTDLGAETAKYRPVNSTAKDTIIFPKSPTFLWCTGSVDQRTTVHSFDKRLAFSYP